jgi:hypothetical protein
MLVFMSMRVGKRFVRISIAILLIASGISIVLRIYAKPKPPLSQEYRDLTVVADMQLKEYLELRDQYNQQLDAACAAAGNDADEEIRQIQKLEPLNIRVNNLRDKYEATFRKLRELPR